MDGSLDVRAYKEAQSSWYQSAIKQKTGHIHAAGMIWDVVFETVDENEMNKKIDDAYRKKYSDSPYLRAMISESAKQAMVFAVIF